MKLSQIALKAKKSIEESSDFIVITYNEDLGINIFTSIGAYAFTMLGGLELARSQMVAGFKERAELEQQKSES